MKNRRFLTSVLAAGLLLAGCGAKTDPSSDTQPTDKPADTEQETAAPDLGPLFERGTVDGQTYVNSFFGIKADFSNEWVLASEDEIATMTAQTSENLNNENAKKQIEEGAAVMDFYAQNPRGAQTLNIYMEDLGLSNASADLIIRGSMNAVKTELESQSFEDVTVEQGTTTFLGEEVPCINIFGRYTGLDFYEKQVFIIKGRNAASITAASFYEDHNDEILNIIQKTE
ncbi:MAG: hypothetical protein IKG53_00615 [Solobacterium sp.]|nr:hypothetical protein [Solobacterium sp.]